MRKSCTPILVVLLFGAAALADPPPSLSGPAAQQAVSAPPAVQTPMQPYTSTDGRFSVFFPGTPAQSSQPIQLKNGETATLYEFSASAGSGNASYLVMYVDCTPDVIAGNPQTLLEHTEHGAVAGKTLLGDQVIDLRGVPGRAYTATAVDGYSYSVHEFLAGDRLYQLIVTTSKGYAATQLNPFMSSFMIL